LPLIAYGGKDFSVDGATAIDMYALLGILLIAVDHRIRKSLAHGYFDVQFIFLIAELVDQRPKKLHELIYKGRDC